MQDLQSVLPESIQFEPPSRAMMSTRRTVSIKPTTGNRTPTGATSSQDIVQFRLPNSGVLASCYLKGTMNIPSPTAGSDATNSFACNQVVKDQFSAGSSWIRRMVVKASDGTELTNVNCYNKYCSIMNRLKNSKEYNESLGSIYDGGVRHTADQVNVGFNSAVIDQTPTGDVAVGGLGISLHSGYELASKRLASSVTGDTFVHQFQTGVLDQSKDFMLPLALLGSGLSLELTCAEVGEVFRVCPSSASASLSANVLDAHPATGATLSGYDISDLELVVDILYYPPELMASLSSKMCQGLKVVCDNVRQQQNAVPQQENTVILSTHARSVKSIVCGVKNSSESGNIRRDESSYYKYPGASGGGVSEVQFSIGSEQCPANPIKYGAQSLIELEKALQPIMGADYKMGNQINSGNYNKQFKADTASAGAGGAGEDTGSGLFGINLQSHPEMPGVLSGKSASAGSISMSCELRFSATPVAEATLETFVISDSVIEFLADGSALVSK